MGMRIMNWLNPKRILWRMFHQLLLKERQRLFRAHKNSCGCVSLQDFVWGPHPPPPPLVLIKKLLANIFAKSSQIFCARATKILTLHIFATDCTQIHRIQHRTCIILIASIRVVSVIEELRARWRSCCRGGNGPDSRVVGSPRSSISKE